MLDILIKNVIENIAVYMSNINLQIGFLCCANGGDQYEKDHL